MCGLRRRPFTWKEFPRKLAQTSRSSTIDALQHLVSQLRSSFLCCYYYCYSALSVCQPPSKPREADRWRTTPCWELFCVQTSCWRPGHLAGLLQTVVPQARWGERVVQPHWCRACWETQWRGVQSDLEPSPLPEWTRCSWTRLTHTFTRWLGQAPTAHTGVILCNRCSTELTIFCLNNTKF